MRLQKQLFLTLLICSALLVTVLFVINTWSFSRGFSSYLSQNRLEPLIEELSFRYAEQSSWDWVHSEGMANNRRPDAPELPKAWLGVVEQTLFSTDRPRRGGHSDRNNHDERNLLSETSNESAGRESRGDATPQVEPRRSRGSRRRTFKDASVLMLADAGKNPIVGFIPVHDVVWLPIESDSQVVGFLGHRNNTELQGLLSNAFAQQQTRSFGLAAAALALLSALLSFPLASRLVRPIASVNAAVGKIRDGEYATRIDTRRKDEIGELASNINSMAQSLESNQQARQRWVAEISHELRTPLAVLQGELEAVEDNIRPLNADTVSALQEQTTRLSRLVNDLHALSMSDLGALDYRFAATNPVPPIKQFIDTSAATLKKAGLSVTTRLPVNLPDINLDQQRFQQLLNNLLQNSVSYTNRGGELIISLETVSAVAPRSSSVKKPVVAGGTRQNWVQLTWADSGPGVTDDQLAQLFEPLYRTDTSRSRRTGGSGLGLAIVQRIVEAHGGTVQASHAEAGGLRLTMLFPPLSATTTGTNL